MQDFGAKGLAWFKVEDSGTLASPIAKNFTPELLAKIGERMAAQPGDLLLFVADQFEVTCKALYALRKRFGEELKLYDPATKKLFLDRRVSDVRLGRGSRVAGPPCTTRSPRRGRRTAVAEPAIPASAGRRPTTW